MHVLPDDSHLFRRFLLVILKLIATFGLVTISLEVFIHLRKNDFLSSMGHATSAKSWKPLGCSMHNFTSNDVKICSEKLEKVTGHPTILGIVGDSSIREIICPIHFRMSRSVGQIHMHAPTSLQYPVENFRIEFQWNPYLANRTLFTYMPEGFMNLDGRVNVILATGGTWHFNMEKDGKSLLDMAKFLEASMKHFSHVISTYFPTTPVLWETQRKLSFTKPIYKKDTIDFYNEEIAKNAYFLARKLYSKSTNIHIWSTVEGIIREVEKMGENPYTDMVHLKEYGWQIRAQVVLNFLCNKIIANEGSDFCFTSDQFVRNTWRVLTSFISCTA